MNINATKRNSKHDIWSHICYFIEMLGKKKAYQDGVFETIYHSKINGKLKMNDLSAIVLLETKTAPKPKAN